MSAFVTVVTLGRPSQGREEAFIMNKNWAAIDTINGSLDSLTEHLKVNPDFYMVNETRELISKVSLAVRQLSELNVVLTENYCNGFLERINENVRSSS